MASFLSWLQLFFFFENGNIDVSKIQIKYNKQQQQQKNQYNPKNSNEMK